jgi:hypothetical protein
VLEFLGEVLATEAPLESLRDSPFHFLPEALEATPVLVAHEEAIGAGDVVHRAAVNRVEVRCDREPFATCVGPRGGDHLRRGLPQRNPNRFVHIADGSARGGKSSANELAPPGRGKRTPVHVEDSNRAAQGVRLGLAGESSQGCGEPNHDCVEASRCRRIECLADGHAHAREHIVGGEASRPD